MMERTEQLLQIKEAMDSKIYPSESETGVKGRKKTHVQKLKKFQARFYWLYEKGMTNVMNDLQGLHVGDALRCLMFLSAWSWSHSSYGVLS